jgi:hypothetical protein
MNILSKTYSCEEAEQQSDANSIYGEAISMYVGSTLYLVMSSAKKSVYILISAKLVEFMQNRSRDWSIESIACTCLAFVNLTHLILILTVGVASPLGNRAFLCRLEQLSHSPFALKFADEIQRIVPITRSSVCCGSIDF